MSSLDYLDLCRLCLVKDRVSVPIFDGEGDVRQIFLKIAACLPVKVAREDKLPKKICDDCVYKVELFYQFWNTTVNAEKQLLQWLGEVGMEGKQGYVTNVLNPNVMKQEQSTENRLDGSVMQQVSEHQNNMGIGMMDNIGLGIPMIISNTNQQQQITSVPMDTSSNSAQNVQAVPGPSSQTTHNQISQNQTSSTQQEEEEESSEDEENSDDECDGDEGLPVKEESEEDPNSRTIEPTTFVNVSLACDEAGPSGLQQQKIADMPEIPMPQTADGDPKSGIPTIAVTPTTLNAAQHSIICNGPFLGIDEMSIQIKDPPPSDNEDNNSVQCDFETNYDYLDKELKLKQEDATDDFVETNYCSLPNISNDSCISSGFNNNSLETEVKQIKEEPYMDTAEINASPRSNIVVFASIGIKNKTVFTCVRIPDLNPSMSADFENAEGQFYPGLMQPPKMERKILPKPRIGLSGEISSFQESDPRMSVSMTNAYGSEAQTVYELLPTVCPYCHNTYTSKNGMQKHFRKYHQDHYCCNDCQYIYETQDLLDEHSRSHAKPPFQCTSCNKKYKHTWGLKQHQIRAHSTIEPKAVGKKDNEDVKYNYECQNKDNEIKTFSCEHCDNAYVRYSHLVAHERITHGIQSNRPKHFECKICNKYFRTESNMLNHSKLHGQRYSCDYCGKSFKDKYLVRIHLRMHTGEKPFECKICFKRYARASGLKLHMIAHTGRKPYVCNICGRSFTQRGSMMIHHRKHPGNHPPPPPVYLDSSTKGRQRSQKSLLH
ncbi:uncharacterized protein LOC143345562 isoform X12 [Colletes latitarsis]|uniref:uncharacterized protein LOC143345562 isoform X12 n=1 Tax=Colletes latitarsis TaxID=2605962 RepID=UPI004035931B